MKVLHVVGARPNFMEVAPVHRAIGRYEQIHQLIVHTGQHYDWDMSDVFFQQLGIPAPDVNLEVGSASHAMQTAQIIMRFEEVALEQRPDLVLVYGDVNSTLAAAVVCAKMLNPVGHVEAGLRSFDRTMPEEINPLLTDQIANLLFTPSGDADENLRREGVAPEKIHLVGNVIVDTLVFLLPHALERWKVGALNRWDGKPYALVTLHRPSNVDEPITLRNIIEALDDISRSITVIFPVHPRTRERLKTVNAQCSMINMHIVDPMSYLDFLALECHAKLVITDSGGIQEETTYLGVPCLTVRGNTERPITVDIDTNILVGQDMERLITEVKRIVRGERKRGQVPPLWDGHAAERIAKVIINWKCSA